MQWKLLTMATRTVDHAKALYAFIETEWIKQGLKGPTPWARLNGFSVVTMLNWRDKGGDVDMRMIRQVAEALHRPVIDVLIAAKYVTVDEAGGYEVPEREYDLLDAIRLDTSLSDAEREALRQVHDAFALVSSGRKRKVTVRSAK